MDVGEPTRAELSRRSPRTRRRSQWIPRTSRSAGRRSGNRAILGLVLLDAAPGRRSEGLAILEEVLVSQPRAELVVEDQATLEMARERLGEERSR